MNSLQDQERRFTENNWEHAEAIDMNQIYRLYLEREDLRRIERLEIFDEFEEWKMIQEHYTVTVAVNDENGVHGLRQCMLSLTNSKANSKAGMAPPPPRFLPKGD